MNHQHQNYWNMIEEAAQWVINCRELCGDEKQALRDWQADNFQLNQTARAHVWLRVQKIWQEARRDAGVK